jgi:hypothetical protein
MAIYHLSVKTISRSQGRSSTAAAAYRAGEKIVDERTGEIHDYTRKSDVLYSELILPNGEQANRAEFWNNIEKHHKRGDAVLVREVEVALPSELTQEQRKQLALSFAKELAERYNIAADISLHAPHKLTSRDLKNNPDQYQEIDPETGEKHNGNWHAHIMLSACHVAQDGTLGKKAVELDPIHCQRAKIENMADRERVRWTELSNAALDKAGHDSRIDHRTLKAQGIDREPTKHLGVEATNYERRTGEKSNKRLDFEQEVAERLKSITEIKELESEARQLEQAINKTKAEAMPLIQKHNQEIIRAEAADAMAKFKQELAKRAATLEQQKQEQAQREQATKKSNYHEQER